MQLTNDEVHFLTAALRGYELKRAEIDRRMAEIRAHLGGAPAVRTKRKLSPEARQRISQAQRLRWARHRRAKLSAGRTKGGR